MAAGDNRPLWVSDLDPGNSSLREMTDADIKDKIVPVILAKWASDQSDAQRGNIQLRATTTTGNLGYFIDTKRDDAVGYHPTGSGSSTVSSYGLAANDNSAESTGGEVWPLYSESASALQEMNAAKLVDDIMRCCQEVYVLTGSNTGVGSYYLGASNPSGSLGGTWINVTTGTNPPSGGEHIDYAQTTAQDSHSTNIYLWRKTSTGSVGSFRPVKYKGTGGDVQEMTDAEIETLVAHWINRITGGSGGNNVGDYEIKTGSASGSGTWTQVGGFTDYMWSVANQQYSTQYSGQYTGQFTGYWSGQYRVHYGNFGGARYGPWYTGQYSTQYSGQYTGQYTGYWTGATIQNDGSSNVINTYNLYKRIG